jgi:organic hydroperoxide reductase OsmC/OhrA
MTTVKSHRFPVSIGWEHGRLTLAQAPGKPDFEIATPPEFKDGIAGVWSPEDLLVAATASCYAITLIAVAEQKALALHDLRIEGTGHVERRPDGRFGFAVIELVATLIVDQAQRERAERVARFAKGVCIVGGALDVPVHLEVNVVAQAHAKVA